MRSATPFSVTSSYSAVVLTRTGHLLWEPELFFFLFSELAIAGWLASSAALFSWWLQSQ